jgi:hypothetical protein
LLFEQPHPILGPAQRCRVGFTLADQGLARGQRLFRLLLLRLQRLPRLRDRLGRVLDTLLPPSPTRPVARTTATESSGTPRRCGA